MKRVDEVGLLRKAGLAAKQAINNKFSKISGAADARADETAALRDMVYRWERWSQQNRQQATPSGVLEFIRQTYGERAFGFAAQEMARMKLVSSTAASASPEAQEAQADVSAARALDILQADFKLPDDASEKDIMRAWASGLESIDKIAKASTLIEGDDFSAVSRFLKFIQALSVFVGIEHKFSAVGKTIRDQGTKYLRRVAEQNNYFAHALYSADVNKVLNAKILTPAQIKAAETMRRGTTEARSSFIRRGDHIETIIESILTEDDVKPSNLSNKQLYDVFAAITPILIRDGIIEINSKSGGSGSGGRGEANAPSSRGNKADDDDEEEVANKSSKDDRTHASVEEGLRMASGGWGSISPAAFKEVLTQARRMSDNFTGFESQISSYEAQIKPLLDNPKMLLWLLARKSR